LNEIILPTPEPDWPASWVISHDHDRLEIGGEESRSGYVYAYNARRDIAIGLLQQVIQPPARVLDVAAGQGNFSIVLAAAGYRVAWNDLREDLIPYVRQKRGSEALTFAPGDIFNLEADPAFDVALMTEVIEHVAHPDRLLARVGELIRPGGFIVLTTPNGAYFRNKLPRFSECHDPAMFESVQFKPDADGHIFLLHRDEVAMLARAVNLQLISEVVFSNPLTSGHVKLEGLLKRLPPTVVRWIEGLTRRSPRAVRDRLHSHSAYVLQRA
jgi:2-polyprenyl-3-methyl-5-hydroxy-6-metoxy-1,4-benzoquinol methylase